MKLGVMGALFGKMKLDEALDYCAKLGLDAIELPAGCYPGHPWKRRGLKSKATAQVIPAGALVCARAFASCGGAPPADQDRARRPRAQRASCLYRNGRQGR